jgi:hypothetical protein
MSGYDLKRSGQSHRYLKPYLPLYFNRSSYFIVQGNKDKIVPLSQSKNFTED